MEELNAITRKEKFLAKAAGQDVETPEPITREEMFLSKIAGGGGASSWNDLKDKPFGEETVSIGDTMTFPEETPINPSDVFVKFADVDGFVIGARYVSESTPSLNELIGGTITVLNETTVISEDMVLVDAVMLAVKYGDLPILSVALEDNALVSFMGTDFLFPKKGFYIVCDLDASAEIYINVLRSITIPGYNFKKEVVNPIDEKFLPDTVARVEDISKAIFGAMEASY